MTTGRINQISIGHIGLSTLSIIFSLVVLQRKEKEKKKKKRKGVTLSYLIDCKM